MDLGYPGQLPILNENAVFLALRACLLLSCKIAPLLSFDRKHYLYKDLPLGYQITQLRNPIGTDGIFQSRKIRHVQLENDTAKIIGEENGTILLDYNRSGLALVEIVTEPEFYAIDEAVEFASSLNNCLVNNGITDRNVEDGSFRVDANMNLQLDGVMQAKVEIKNVMGFKFLRQALGKVICTNLYRF